MGMTGKNSTTLCLTVPNKILELIDRDVTESAIYSSRQQWINAAIIDKIQSIRPEEKVSDGRQDGLGCNDGHPCLKE